MSITPHRPRRTRGRRGPTGAVTLAAIALGLAACGSPSSSTGGTSTTAVRVSGSITVSAASSLTGAFGTLGTMFQTAHPGATIRFNFGSSGTLANQIIAGAPADVFASASPSVMDTVRKAGDIVGIPVTFARNSLEIVVKPGNPLGIHSLADLTKPNVVALCVSSAPCGSTADQALKNAGVTLPTSKITLGQDVDSTFAEVTTGDADAAVVYVTNAKKAGDQGVGVPIPPSENVSTSYPIAVVRATKNRSLALAWIAYVLGPTGQGVLLAASFLAAH
jgi:molybdate transport system substrate-binding protein